MLKSPEFVLHLLLLLGCTQYIDVACCYRCRTWPSPFISL